MDLMREPDKSLNVVRDKPAYFFFDFFNAKFLFPHPSDKRQEGIIKLI